jgi:cytochrome c oxidase assembly protein subunit 15
MNFYRLALTTLLLVFCVILAGGVVRTTGSGMGCPDWPKCFGRYIPPTDISQLPSDYKTVFAVKGKQIADFDAFKTWVEYINRLLGALLGVAILVVVVESRKIWNHDQWLPILSVILLLVTGFVGWLGSVVVATDLEPTKITLHMMTSIVIVFIATVVVFRAAKLQSLDDLKNRSIPPILSLQTVQKRIQLLIVAALVLTLSQIVMGTQVREQVDNIAKMLEGRWREQWVEQLSQIFVIHRSASWLFVLLNGVIIWYIAKSVNVSEDPLSRTLRRLSMGLGTLIVGEIVLGVTMAYFAIPKFAQPLHLLLALGIFSLQSLLFLYVSNGKVSKAS